MLRDLRATPVYRQIEDYYRSVFSPGNELVVDAADLNVRPDGGTAAFTGTVYRDLSSPPTTRICVVDLCSGELSHSPAPTNSDRQPRYSPDGRLLALLSDRAQAGNFQLYVGPATETSAVAPRPAVDGTVERIQWSPDGSRLLLGTAGFGADVAGCEGGAKTVTLADDLPAWIPQIEAGDAENLWRSLHVHDIESGATKPVTLDGLNPWEADWLGTGGLVVIASDSHSEGSWYRTRLVRVDLDSGRATTLYRPRDQIGLPAGSPSGEKVAVVEAVCSDRLIVAGRLLLLDAESGAMQELDTAGVDVTHHVWRDEHRLAYAGHRAFETVVGELDTETGSRVEHWADEGHTIGNWYPSIWPHPGGGCVGLAEAWDIAPEIAIFRDATLRRVRSLATDASSSDGWQRGNIEPVRWRARDDLEIHGWLVRPSGNGPLPLVMDIHGGPVWACRNRWHGRQRGAKVLTDYGYAVLYPNPRGSSCRGQELARLVVGDMGGEDTYDYLTGLDALVERGLADPERLGVTGISYGGFMSAWLITQDTRFAAAVPISPVTDWYSQHRTSQIPFFDQVFLDASPSEAGGRFFDRSPVMFASRVTTPTLQLAGALDQNTPPTQALELHRSLLEVGVDSVLATYPTAGHGIRTFPEVIDATARYVSWFLEHMPPTSP